jgi:hypothetical protein
LHVLIAYFHLASNFSKGTVKQDFFVHFSVNVSVSTLDPDYQIGRVLGFEDRVVNIVEFKFDLPLLNAAENFYS